jgi:hypothetical protein
MFGKGRVMKTLGCREVTVMVLLLALGPAGCQDQEEVPEVDPSEVQAPDRFVNDPTPDTTAQAVWEHLQAEAYGENWDFWPEREPYYEGTEPHGTLLNTYLNGLAFRGLLALRDSNGSADLPFGSIIVKENYAPDSTLAAVTIMYKAEGFDPAHHDWWWMKRLPDGTVEASGEVPSCIQCHEAAEGWDYLMTEANRHIQ